MTPYFTTVKSFADISSPDVHTNDFLDASDGLVKMFDLLGSGVFGFVQTDIKNNIAGVRRRRDSARDNSATLESLIQHEQETVDGHKDGTACLVRLLRGLALTCNALQNMQNDPNVELHVCFKRSYDVVLRHHHSFLVRSAVSVAIRAVPRRSDFYNRIAQGGSTEDLDDALRLWLDGLENVVLYMKMWLQERNYGKV